MGGWFVTGTDTGVGKTLVARALLKALRNAGQSAVGMKPVASGCRATDDGWRSDDALELMEASAAAVAYTDVNPYTLAAACAPHIAAREGGVEIQPEKILESFRRLQQKFPWIVVEGVGGWMVPLGERLTMADVARALGLPVILVVGLRLGCLNHALLTVEAIRRANIPIAGWVANRIDPAMTHVPENIATLAQSIGAPLLARIPYQSAAKPEVAGAAFPVDEMIMRFNQG